MSFELTRATPMTDVAATELVSSLGKLFPKGVFKVNKGWIGGITSIQVSWTDDYGSTQTATMTPVAGTNGFTLPNEFIKLAPADKMNDFKQVFKAAGFTNADEIQVVAGGGRKGRKGKKQTKKSKKSNKTSKKSKKSKKSKSRKQ